MTEATDRAIPSEEAAPSLIRTEQPDPTGSEGRASFPMFHAPSRAAVVLVVAGAIVAVLAYMAGEILTMFAIGLIIVYLIDPVVTMLARRGLPRALGTLLMMTVLAIGLFIVAEITFRAIVQQGTAFIKQLPADFEALKTWYEGLDLPSTVTDLVNQVVNDLRDRLAAIDWGGIVLGIAAGVFGLLGSFFSIMGLVFFVFYATADRPRLTSAMTRTIPIQWRGDTLAVSRIALDLTGHYVWSEGVLMVILGVMTWVGLMLLSVLVDPAFADFALFLAFIAALGGLIPTFGPIIALIPALLFSLSLGPEAVFATLALYILIMFIEGQILVPNIQGHAVEVHPALVIVLILCGMAVAGIIGAIVVLPLAAIFRDVTAYAFRRAAGILPPAEIDVDGNVQIPELPPESAVDPVAALSRSGG